MGDQQPTKDRAVRLNLRENAYDFLEESLRYADLASEDPAGWKFAIVLAAQGTELLLKARLADEHPLLVLANPDKPPPARTVDVDAAISRLMAAGVSLDKEDVNRLRRARRLRNDFMHYEVNATVGQLEATFADLFEFAHVFHADEFGSELHGGLSEDLYAVEAEVMERFRRDVVVYQGSEVVRWFPAEIVDAQFALRITVNGETYSRIRRGGPEDLFGERDNPCHDCMVVRGQLHAFGCDSERCPRCLGQMLSCDCDWEWEYADEIDAFVVKGELASDLTRPGRTASPPADQ